MCRYLSDLLSNPACKHSPMLWILLSFLLYCSYFLVVDSCNHSSSPLICDTILQGLVQSIPLFFFLSKRLRWPEYHFVSIHTPCFRTSLGYQQSLRHIKLYIYFNKILPVYVVHSHHLSSRTWLMVFHISRTR